MSGHYPARSAIWAAAAAIIVPAIAACSSTSTTASTGTSAAAVASIGPNGHKPTLSGAGSTFDAPFFAAAFARYQQHPGVTIGYSAVGSGAGIAAFSARQVDFGAFDVPMTASEQAAAKGGPVTQVPVALGGGYVPLPAGIQQLARTMLQQITGPTGAHLLS